MTRLAVLTLLMLELAACTRPDSNFTVKAPGARSANLDICGRKTALKRSGAGFSIEQPARCETEGAVMVTFEKGPQVFCHVGATAAGVSRAMEFEIKDGQCRIVRIDTIQTMKR